MADFPNTIESISFQSGHTVDDIGIEYGFVLPGSIGFKACRLIGVFEQYVNKVWDPGGPAWVSWETEGEPDFTGQSYPDPYATGFGGTQAFRFSGLRYR